LYVVWKNTILLHGVLLHGLIPRPLYSGTQFLYEFFHSQWTFLSMLPTLTPFRELKNWSFVMNFFWQENLYVNNIGKKIQGQKIYTKKDIWIPPTYIDVKKKFNAANFDTLPRAQKLLFCHENFLTRASLC